MSKLLDISAVTDAAQIKIKSGTLQFLQDANTERFSAILIGLIGAAYNPTTIYVIYGVQNTGTAPNYIISAGAVFYNGEMFMVDATSFTTTGSNVPVFSIGITQYTTNADPVTFTDNTVHNVHNIRKMVITGAASGSGIANYSTAYFLTFAIPSQINLTASGQAVASGVYPNININVPNATNLNPVLYAGSYNVGDETHGIGNGGTDYVITFPAVSTANYYVVGTIISNGNPETDVTLSWNIRARTTTSFTLHVVDYNGGVQNVAFEFILFAK